MENIEAMLCAFIEGDLDPAGCAEIEKHLEANPQHRKLIAELIATRDMVRNLPRVKAPIDVGESLRGQVERSILLDDSAPRASDSRMRINRWPQYAAVAAVFVLTAGLGIVVFKMVTPTFKTPQFTRAPEMSDKQSQEPVASDKMEKDGDLAGAAAPTAAVAAKGGAGNFSPPGGNSLANAANSNVSNFDAIENRLKVSGEYSFNRGASVTNAAPTNAPLMMVFDNAAPVPADDKVINFLNNAGIKFMPIPDVAATQPATLPSAGHVEPIVTTQGENAAADNAGGPQPVLPHGAQMQVASRDQSQSGAGGSFNLAQPTTAPSMLTQNSFGPQNGNGSNQDVIVARRMTRQQAAALREEMSKQIGPVQVYESSANIVGATTQPTANVALGASRVDMKSAATGDFFGASRAMPATQPEALIASGDTLLIHASNLSIPEGEQVQSLKVDEQGTLSLPGLESVPVVGKNNKQVQDSLAKAYDDAKMSDKAEVVVKKVGAPKAMDETEKDLADSMDVVIVIQNGAQVGNTTLPSQQLVAPASTTQPADR